VRLLDKDPSKRPSAVELLEHPWFNPDVLDQIVLEGQPGLVQGEQ